MQLKNKIHGDHGDLYTQWKHCNIRIKVTMKVRGPPPSTSILHLKTAFIPIAFLFSITRTSFNTHRSQHSKTCQNTVDYIYWEYLTSGFYPFCQSEVIFRLETNTHLRQFTLHWRNLRGLRLWFKGLGYKWLVVKLHLSAQTGQAAHVNITCRRTLIAVLQYKASHMSLYHKSICIKKMVNYSCHVSSYTYSMCSTFSKPIGACS